MPGTEIRSLADLRDRHVRDDSLAFIRRVALAAVSGACLALPIALVLVGTLALAPTVTLPSGELVALTVVSMWGLLALVVTAMVAAR